MNALMAIVHYDCCSEQQVKSSLVSGLRTLSRQDNNSEIFLSVSQQAQIGLGGVFYNDNQQYFAQNESFSIIFSGKILFPASIQNLLGCNFQANMAQNILLLYPTMENKIFSHSSKDRIGFMQIFFSGMEKLFQYGISLCRKDINKKRIVPC